LHASSLSLAHKLVGGGVILRYLLRKLLYSSFRSSDLVQSLLLCDATISQFLSGSLFSCFGGCFISLQTSPSGIIYAGITLTLVVCLGELLLSNVSLSDGI
jgi:hypothetical protein